MLPVTNFELFRNDLRVMEIDWRADEEPMADRNPYCRLEGDNGEKMIGGKHSTTDNRRKTKNGKGFRHAQQPMEENGSHNEA